MSAVSSLADDLAQEVGVSEGPTTVPTEPALPSAMAAKASGGKVIHLAKRKSSQPAAKKNETGGVAPAGYEVCEQDFAEGSDRTNGPSLGPSLDGVPGPDSPPVSTEQGNRPPAAAGGQAVPATAVGTFCTVLDIIDRPFRGVGATPRRIIGWLALAILLAVVGIFFLSVLR